MILGASGVLNDQPEAVLTAIDGACVRGVGGWRSLG
jgi:hypothetical protein